MTETLWPTKPKILTPCPFMEKAHVLISDLEKNHDITMTRQAPLYLPPINNPPARENHHPDFYP